MQRIISFLLIFATLAANARQITSDEAQSIAYEFFNPGITSKSMAKKALRRVVKANAPTSGRVATSRTETQPYYIFNADDNTGFVIISGDTRVKKILGHSDRGSFDTTNMPPQLKALLENYAKAFELIPASQPEDESWLRSAAPESGEGVLLETANWGQGYPYNLLTPEINGEHCVAGCMATAMAEILHYYKWPEKGVGTTHGVIVDHALNESETVVMQDTYYDWDNMLSNYHDTNYTDQEAIAVATLMRHCGAAVEMDYGLLTSGAYGSCASFVKYFGFDVSAHEIKRSRDNDFDNQIYKEIKEGRPVLLCGDSPFSGIGHAFIIDGYDSDDHFHINYGWDGLYNGYYCLAVNTNSTEISSNATEYYLNQIAYIGLQPYKGEPISISIDETNFPAPICEYLRNQAIDIDSNGLLSYNELNGVDVIDLQNLGVMSLGCMNMFGGITRIHCDNNHLTEIDLSNYPYLTWFSCENNSLKNIDFSNNPLMEVVMCQFNELTALELDNNPYIEILYCGHNNLSNIDVSILTILEHFTCENNQLSNLDVSNNTLLKYIRCDYNNIESLDVANNPEINNINCERNNIKKLDISNLSLLEILYVTGNQLSELNTSNNPLIKHLSVDENRLSQLNVSHNPDITNLSCSRNQLTELNLSGNPALTQVFADNNQLSSLVLPVSTSLFDVECYYNNLTSLDVSSVKSLADLRCHSNQLKCLDVTNNSELVFLHCNDNLIETLDCTNNLKIERLSCYQNELRELHVPEHSNLREVCFYNNKITEIKINDSPNLEKVIGWSNDLKFASIERCPNLQKIELGQNPMAYAVFNDINNLCDISLATYPLEVELDENSRLDSSILPGFDLSKVSDYHGGTISGNTIVFNKPNEGKHPEFKYKYDTGAGLFDFSLICSKTSGMEDITIEQNDNVKIFNLQGGLLYEGKYSDSQLSSGVYIIMTQDKNIKRIIR